MRTGLRWATGLLYDRPYILLTLTSLFWGGNIVLARYIAGHVPPVAVSYIRWMIAFLILIPFAWRHVRRDFAAMRASLLVMAALALSGTAAPNTMAFYGLQYTQAINALLIQSTGPLLIGFWTLLLFGERLSLGQTAGILISLVGVIIIVCRGNPEALRSVAFNSGDLWVIGSLLVFGFYSALARKRPSIHPLSFLVFNIGLGTIMLTPLYAWEVSSGHTLVWDLKTFFALAYVSVFPSLLGYLFFNRGVELIGPNRAAPFLHLTPFFGSALAIALLGERLEGFHLIGYALILAGITVATMRR
ncbi:MAG TPA: DMT family transporter [Pseudorhodoplanes sp.]|nr:DMT family transporter [Pseudorhodoplanes sp.]